MAGKAVFRLAQVSVLLAVLLVLNTCGGSHRVAPAIQPAADTSLDETLTELAGMETPEGVDEALWVELKDALNEALEERASSVGRGFAPRRDTSADDAAAARKGPPYRFVATPPTGEANRVNDLTILDNGDGTFTLSWHYMNLGDYDQDGTVGISDITPLAQHYNESYEPENVNCVQAVIDGSGNGRIGIEDITPLAIHFAEEIHHYAVEGAAEEAGAYELVSEVSQDAGTGDGRLEYSAVIQSPAALWHRVVPVDSEGTPGEPSNTVLRPSNEPIIYGVSPTEGYQHEEYTFTATVSGVEPLEYAWDFGGGADPDTSSGLSPTVTLADAGEYAASLTVTNAYDSATYPFTLTVNERDMWAHTWGGGEGDFCYDVLIGGDESVYLSGLTSSFGGGNIDGLVVKFGMSGDLIWARTWGGEEAEYTGDVALDSGGNVITAGGTNGFGEGKDDILLTKYSPQGDLLRVMTWGTGDYERHGGMAVDALGNIYICGYWVVYGGDSLALMVKLDLEWNVQWAKRWGGTWEDRAYGILPHDGAVYVCGETASFGEHDGDAFLMKMTPDGEVLWARTWGTELEDSFSALTIGPDGCIYLVGRSKNVDTKESAGFILKYDAEGNLLGTKGWKGALGSAFSDVCLGPDPSIGVVGADGWHLLFLIYDSELRVQLSKAWGHSDDSHYGRCCAWDEEGNFIAAGEADDGNGSWVNADDSSVDIEGVERTIEGSVWDLEGVSHTPEGTETSPEGVLDTGGGHGDILLLKNFPR